MARRAGRDEQAIDILRRAVDAIDVRGAEIGPSQESRSIHEVRAQEVYRDLLSTLVRLGRLEEALHVLERSRARVLLEWIAERDLALPAGTARDLERERQEIRHGYERSLEKLATLSPIKNAEEVDHWREKLWDLRRRQGRLAQALRQSSPGAADLRYPRPLDAGGVARELDPGTVLLAYSVAPDETYLFVMAAPPSPNLEVFRLPVGEAQLREHVTAFRQLVASTSDRRLREAGRSLFDLLVAAADARIASADRIVICPDGPLHTLPSPIRHPTRAAGGLGPLPAAREEVHALARLFGERSSTFVGEEATEARVRTATRGVRYVHFACHGRIDDRFPLDSALVLSPGANGDNGLLHAWEIFEDLRLDADLVTLSACETALGPERGGEGLMSLTRASLYAGARSTLASLWSVPDASTARLMESFYLLRGLVVVPAGRSDTAARLFGNAAATFVGEAATEARVRTGTGGAA